MWTYRLIDRRGQVAFFERSSLDGEHFHYEVCILRTNPEKAWPDGRVTEAHESLPPPEKWGSEAWTFSEASHKEPRRAARERLEMLALCRL